VTNQEVNTWLNRYIFRLFLNDVMESLDCIESGRPKSCKTYDLFYCKIYRHIILYSRFNSYCDEDIFCRMRFVFLLVQNCFIWFCSFAFALVRRHFIVLFVWWLHSILTLLAPVGLYSCVFPLSAYSHVWGLLSCLVLCAVSVFCPESCSPLPPYEIHEGYMLDIFLSDYIII